MNMLQVDEEGTCVTLDEAELEGTVQEITEGPQEAVDDSTTAVEDAGEDNSAEDKDVVHSIGPVEPEDDSWFF